MCLIVDAQQTKDYQSSMAETVKVYKIVFVKDGKLYSMYRNMEYKVGINKSDSKRKIVVRKDGARVHRGIHVYIDKKTAKRRLSSVLTWSSIVGLTVIELTARKQDFISCSSNKVATFTKVALSKKEYDAAVKKEKKKQKKAV